MSETFEDSEISSLCCIYELCIVYLDVMYVNCVFFIKNLFFMFPMSNAGADFVSCNSDICVIIICFLYLDSNIYMHVF